MDMFLTHIKNKFLKTAFFLFALFLLTRIFVMFYGASKFFCESELYRGTLAYEIMTNRAWPLLTYQAETHTGGSFIGSLVVIPFLIIFGKNLIAIKLAGLLFSALTFLCIFYYIVRCMGMPRTALFVACWLIFSPPLYWVYSVVFLGEHFESQLFSFISLIVFWKMLDVKAGPLEQLLWSALFGFVCGFSTYFSYTFIITLGTCALAWFLIDYTFFLKKQFFIFAACFVIGFCPRFIFNHLIDDSTLQIYGSPLADHITFSWDVISKRIHFLISFYWPHGLWLGDVGDVRKVPFMGSALGMLFIFSLIVIVKKLFFKFFNKDYLLKKRALLPVLIYPLMFFVIHAINDYADEFIGVPFSFYQVIDDYSEFKHIFSLYPFVFIIISIFFIKKYFWQKLRFFKSFPFFICLFFWAVSFWDVAGLMSIDNYDKHVKRWRPYSYHLLGEQVVRIYSQKNIYDKVRYVEKIDLPYRKYAYLGFGYAIDDEINYAGNIDDLLPLISQESQPSFVRGLGAACAEHLMDLGDATYLDKECPFFNNIPEKLQINFIEGIGVSISLSQGEDLFKSDNNLYQAAYYRGYAVGTLRLYRGDVKKTIEQIKNIPNAYHQDFFMGLSMWDEFFIDFYLDNLEELIEK